MTPGPVQSSTSSKKPWARRVLVVVVLVLVGGAVGWLARGVDAMTPNPLSEPPSSEAVVIEVEPTDRTVSTSVAVVVSTRPGPALASPREGVLTSLDVAAGAEIVNGSRVFTVNDVPVVAMASAAPLYRTLARGDRGQDVTRFQQWLSSLGYAVDADGRYESATAAAVADFRQRNDLPGSGGGVFEREWVAWIGPSGFAPVQVAVSVGASVGAGTLVAQAGPVATAVEVSELAPYPAGVDSLLEVGTASVPYLSGSGIVDDPDASAAVAAALGAETEGAGQVRSVSGEKVMVLPAGAVVTDAEGASCVFPDVGAKPVAVTVAGSAVGTQSITPVDGLTSVLANPTTVIRSPSCG